MMSPHKELPRLLQPLLGEQFRLERELPGAGMSRVFVAHEVELDRRVAVKVLPPELVTSDAIARFRREMQLTAQLQHPHILPVITAGGRDDLLYFVTPYVEGESLRGFLAKGERVSFDAALAMALELLSAATYAHARGIVHRDIKPGNVLLSGRHSILADFGIARALHADDDAPPGPTGSSLAGSPV